ncbi:CDP-glycerol--poly(glycerophosphate) glycerophosphotransferase [Nitrosopumilus maritimus]|uniref:CDP-glycerol:poly(Glycerophosphate) glycerophosphotransferase n=1 Tax=Nitrosopumilus maritimus (strain SCM1) TaxID=436308 RepID=A9A3D1_NITMS|nr:CDP-glycerol--poly(glycerophosphate) glycerophosphotransferase [Nitrosopumilus maritimus]ABX12560.1 CDP-glycerol:poly(glycerophosphate) glycerophosphotransferase [Nitrosopumilus maritimus SCM1]
MGFFSKNESTDLKEFSNLDIAEKQIVFYSEDKNSTIIFESFIDELIKNYDVSICYVTSSKEELDIISKNKKIKAFYVGEGVARTKFFLELQANILIMTMPDLEAFHIKRSKMHNVHYIYMFHSMISTHLGYRKEAFDYFDSIFCVGNYQINEIKEAEKLYNLKAKKLVQFGYTHLDNLLKIHSKNTDITLKQKDSYQIIIAPSWGKDGLFETVSEKIINILLNSGYKVILRIHPMTQKKSKKKVEHILKTFSKNSNFFLEQNISYFDSFLQSDIMISDWSGVALEFAFGFEKPVMYIDTPKKMRNPNFKDISQIPIEESIRNKIGIIVPTTELETIPKKIEEIYTNQESIKNQIRNNRDETVFNIGKSVIVGTEYIIKLLKKK